jgi:hypothetical protein
MHMSRTLSDVLHEYAVKHHARAEEIRATMNEWLNAIEELLDTCRVWLREADKDKVLRIEDDTDEIPEEPFGRYQVPILVVRLGTAEVKIQPTRRTASRPYLSELPSIPEGKAEMVNHLRQRSALFRLKDEQGMRWVIMDPLTRAVAPLTRETFDAAMASLLE